VTIGLLLITVIPIAIEIRRKKKRDQRAKDQPQQVR
jgi:hypothetical protein